VGKIERSHQAEKDLIDIWCYIAADSPRAADAMLDRMGRIFKKLSVSPLMGRSREELAPGIRSFPVGDYLIFYRLIPDGIVVVRVLSGYRNLPELFEGS
jgi:toxin ParE1/3/4